MKKLLIIGTLIWSSFAQAVPPVAVNGEQQATRFVQNVVVPNNQATNTGGINTRLELNSTNELTNPNFEASTVDSGWSYVGASSAVANTSTMIEGKKAATVTLAANGAIYQRSTINVAQKSGVQMTASIWVNSSTVSDLQLCNIKTVSNTEDKCTTSGAYVAGSGWKQLTVSFLGDSTYNGLKLKSTTGGVVQVDQASLGVGAPIVSFNEDNVYSATASGIGGVSNLNKEGWISTCVMSGTGSATFTCPITGFTSRPNCSATAKTLGWVATYNTSSSSSSSIVFQTQTGGAANADTISIVCEKTGADYKSSSAYVASNADFGPRSETFTTTNMGNATVTGTVARQGAYAIFDGKITLGSTLPTGAAVYTLNLPSGYSVVDQSFKLATATYQSSGFLSGAIYSSTPTTIGFTSNSGGGVWSATTGGVPAPAAGHIIYFTIKAQISGWDASGVIVGTFEGHNMTTETFSGNGSTTAFTLAKAPSTINNTQVYINGVYQQKSTYSISGTTLTFSEAPPAGTSNIEVNQALINAAAVPSDGSVTRAKLDSTMASTITQPGTPATYYPVRRQAILNCAASSSIISGGNGETWVSSIGNISSGACTITVAASKFATIPICSVVPRGNTVASTSWKMSENSTTSLSIYCSTGGVNCGAGEQVNVFCDGLIQ